MAGVAQAQAWRRQAWRRQARRRQARRGAVGPEADAAHLGWRRLRSAIFHKFRRVGGVTVMVTVLRGAPVGYPRNRCSGV